jgi:hypothetical protein
VAEIRVWNWTHGNQEFLKQCQPQARGIIADIDLSYRQALGILCQSECPCKIQSSSEELVTDQTIGAINIMGCNRVPEQLTEEEIFALGELESSEQCAGICDLAEFYVFSSTEASNRPTDSCLVPLQTHIR